MTEVFYPPRGASASLPGHPESSNLADVLERVLDRGIVIAGDIEVRLLDIELLTIKLRLLVASVDRAREMGINWWESDPTLSMGQPGKPDDENHGLERRLERLESRLGVSDGNGDAKSRGTDAGMERPRARRRAGGSAKGAERGG